MVDKILETDREVTLEYVDIEGDNNFEIAKHENVLIDLIEQKRAADMSDKVNYSIFLIKRTQSLSTFIFQICPMCSKFYSQDVLFEEFQEHVEAHFRSDDSNEMVQRSIDNFELVSHTVGNF